MALDGFLQAVIDESHIRSAQIRNRSRHGILAGEADFIAVLGEHCINIVDQGIITPDQNAYLHLPTSKEGVANITNEFVRQCRHSAYGMADNVKLSIPVCTDAKAGHWILVTVTVQNGSVISVELKDSMYGAKEQKFTDFRNKEQRKAKLKGLFYNCFDDIFSEDALAFEKHRNEQRESSPTTCCDHVILAAQRELRISIVNPSTGYDYYDLRFGAYANGNNGAINLRNITDKIIADRFANLDTFTPDVRAMSRDELERLAFAQLQTIEKGQRKSIIRKEKIETKKILREINSTLQSGVKIELKEKSKDSLISRIILSIRNFLQGIFNKSKNETGLEDNKPLNVSTDNIKSDIELVQPIRFFSYNNHAIAEDKEQKNTFGLKPLNK
jgi:hypothetical protein